MTRGSRFLLAAALLLLAVIAPHAFAVGANATINYKLPPSTVSGQPLTGANALTEVQIFISATPIPDPTSCSANPVGLTPVRLLPNGTLLPLNYVYSSQAGAVFYIRIRVMNSTCGSDLTPNLQHTMPAVPERPGLPTDISITVSLQ